MLNGKDTASWIRFGPFEADLRAGELRKHGIKLKLQEQPFRILVMLLKRPGQVVTRDDLRKTLWDGDTFVDFDSGLNKAMNRLREALADTADNPRFIETLPKRGYRFIAPVETVGNSTENGPRLASASNDTEFPRPLPGPHLIRVRTAKLFAWAVGLVALMASVLGIVAWFHGPAEPARMLRSSLLPPPNTSFLPSNFEISPDGTRLAFVAAGPDESIVLWVRLLSAAGAQRLSGTEGARFPFWSPDSRYIGFFAAGKLKTLDVAGGVVHVLCDAPSGMGGSWSRDSSIVFAPNIAGSLYRIPAAGGTPTPITPLPGKSSGQNHMAPWFLPDGEHFLYVAVHSGPSDRQANGTYIGSLDSADTKLVSSELTGRVAFSSGRLLYVRESNLMAQPFDPKRLQTTGPPSIIAEQEMEPDPGFWWSTFTVYETGLLAFRSITDSPSRLVWTDGAGVALGEISEAGFKDPSLSPDGRLLAVSSDDAHSGKRYIRVYDLARGVSTRLTNGGSDQNPIWSRDSKEITYASRDGNLSYISKVAADGSRLPTVVLKGANMSPGAWSSGGDLLLGRLMDGNPDLAVYSIADHRVTPFARGVEAQFSPNGKWIAYVWRGVHVQSFPGPGPRIQISEGSGGQPRWSRDGRRLFYIAPDSKLMAVNFDTKTGAASAPYVVFQTRIVAPSYAGFQYDVASDRFLINSLPYSSSFPLTLISGWATTR